MKPNLRPLLQYVKENNITQAKLGEMVGGNDQTLISHKLRGSTRFQPLEARKLEKITKGVVKKEHLRPDIWGPINA